MMGAVRSCGAGGVDLEQSSWVVNENPASEGSSDSRPSLPERLRCPIATR